MRYVKLGLLLTTGLFLYCTSDPSLAGPSTELENPTFTGLVLYKSLSPVTDANITVYKIVEVSNESSKDTFGIEIISSKTDYQGEFSINKMSMGKYLIKSNTSDSSLSALISIELNEIPKSTIRDTLILDSPGSLRGVVTRDGQQQISGNQSIRDGDIRVVLAELNQSVITGPDGRFAFSKIPDGVYSLAIYPGESFFSETRKSIVVTSGNVTTIDTVHLTRIPWVKPPKPQGLTITYDTNSAFVTLKWNKVKINNLLGYVVEQRLGESILNPTETFIKDTVYKESVISFPAGTQIYYSIRSVTFQFEESYPEGPVNIIVKK